MKVFHLEDIGPHYATTLRHVARELLRAAARGARSWATRTSFIRMWEFYLCYCEGGFLERQLGDVQMLLDQAALPLAGGALAAFHLLRRRGGSRENPPGSIHCRSPTP